jgi:hypothetical protein
MVSGTLDPDPNFASSIGSHPAPGFLALSETRWNALVSFQVFAEPGAGDFRASGSPSDIDVKRWWAHATQNKRSKTPARAGQMTLPVQNLNQSEKSWREAFRSGKDVQEAAAV